MLERHRELYAACLARYRLMGLAAKDNLANAKKQGVKDAVFAKKRGCRYLTWPRALVYKMLRNFRPASKLEYPSSSAPSVLTVHLEGWEGFGRMSGVRLCPTTLVLARTKLN